MKLLYLKKYAHKEGTQYTLRIFGLYMFVLFKSAVQKCGWVRIFGIGIEWKHKDNPLTFSERNKAANIIRIGQYNIGFLECQNFE